MPNPFELMPPGSTVSSDGRLLIGGCVVDSLAEAFGTPMYAYDEAALRGRARSFVHALADRWPNSSVVWASKSMPMVGMYRLLGEEGLHVDVAGGGELVMALRAGVRPDRLVMHGNAKTDDELRTAVDAGVGLIVLDNFDDIARLERIVRGEQAVLIRVIPNVDTDTHPANATGHSASKFGFPDAQARRAIKQLRTSSRLRLEGLHSHVGSQILSTRPFTQEVEALASYGEFPVYDLGGGFGARYTYHDAVPSVDEYLDALIAAARAHLPASARLLIEPGRSMVAESGVTVYTVTTVKRDGARTIVAVDGGMGDNLEVSLYGQRFEATLADRLGGSELCTVVGRHCESGDQLIDGVLLDAPEVGDLLVVPVTGAYCYTLANNYNGALRPPVVFCNNGAPRLVSRRETYADLMVRDIPPVPRRNGEALPSPEGATR